MNSDPAGGHCVDCDVDVEAIAESCYMVQTSVWLQANLRLRDFACIGCLETRLGRALTWSDFSGARMNAWSNRQSPRLQSRISGGAPAAASSAPTAAPATDVVGVFLLAHTRCRRCAAPRRGDRNDRCFLCAGRTTYYTATRVHELRHVAKGQIPAIVRLADVATHTRQLKSPMGTELAETAFIVSRNAPLISFNSIDDAFRAHASLQELSLDAQTRLFTLANASTDPVPRRHNVGSDRLSLFPGAAVAPEQSAASDAQSDRAAADR